MNPYCMAFLFAGLSAVAWGQQTTTITVPANQSWTRTGIYLNPGSSVQIEAQGEIEAVSPADTRAMFHHVPPAGRPERQENKPQPQMPALVLLARIGNGPVLEAGARSQFQAGGRNGTGELLLGINDDNVVDNTGSWTARVTVTNSDSNISQQRNSRSQDNSNQNGRYQNDRNQNGRDQNGQYPNDRYPNDRNSDNRNSDNRYPDNRGQNDRSQADRSRNDRYENDRSQAGQSSRNDNIEAVRSLDNMAQRLGRNVLGSAAGDIRTTADGLGRYREYRNGAIYWSPNTGTHAVLGQIYDEWRRRGAETGDLGYPTSDESNGRDGATRVMRFERGTITWSDRTGARVNYDR